MTLTQVSTWFANARRRLKKENKWSPEAGFEDDEEPKGKEKFTKKKTRYRTQITKLTLKC